ncbi:MerR family transcriptional regulator [Nocardia sp. NPDC050710]|uniref:DNA polymerase III subunit beta family protein n=1 Tax=Nocardia sp. NPDC050710 TaxID=3157220 RepID=UPI0033EAD20E
MTDSETDELITIGAVARASGLTASALRFYDDCGLLAPDRVDEATGYRYYARAQCEQAVLIRRLRGVGVPLETISGILSGDRRQAEQLLDDHVRELTTRARAAARVAVEVKRTLGARRPTVTLCGAVLAQAIDQVVGAAARDRAIPVLAGVSVEVNPGSVTLTATDRYRLTTRTLVPDRQDGGTWATILEADDLAGLSTWARDIAEISVAHAGDGMVFAGDGIERRCAAIAEIFPDYRAMLADLAPVVTRVMVRRAALLESLEADGDPLVCTIDLRGISVSARSREARRISAATTGPGIDIAFSATTLRPAIADALGPDIMLDISAADRPIVVRSATDGDLTTLVMPTAIPKTLQRQEHS